MKTFLITVISGPVVGMGIALVVLLGTIIKLHQLPPPIRALPPEEAAKLVAVGLWAFFGVGMRYYYRIKFSWQMAAVESILCSILATVFIAWASFSLFIPDESKRGIGVLVGGMAAALFGSVGLTGGVSFGATYGFLWAIATASGEPRETTTPAAIAGATGIHTEAPKDVMSV